MTSVGKKFGINFNRGRTGKKKSLETAKDELDLDLRLGSRKGSHGALSPTFGLSPPLLKTSKSNSLGSVNSDLGAGDMVDPEEVVLLTHYVRNFSETLGQLRTVFCQKQDMTSEDLKASAHERLGEVLKILKEVLQKYPALHTTDVLTAAAILITRVKNCRYEALTGEAGELLQVCDQLALAFSSSVSDYLMGDSEQCPNLGKTKSYDNLLAGSDTDPATLPSRLIIDCGGEEVDAVLRGLEGGVEKALQRAKVWAKYAKEVLTYVEKRASLEADYAKSIAKHANALRQTITEEECLPFQTVYHTAFDQDVSYYETCQASLTLLQQQKFVEPLSTRRLQHEKLRKSLKDAWTRELRRMHDAVNNLRKAKALYVSRRQEQDKAKEASQKAENDCLTQSASQQLVTRADKKRRLEEDANAKAVEAETTYQGCVVEANARQQELDRVKGHTLGAIRELIFQSDKVLKTVTVGYFQLLHTIAAPAPVQFQSLCDSSQHYEPGSHYADYIRKLPIPLSGAVSPTPFKFEPYTSDSKLYELRKPSSHSSGSSSELIGHPEDSPATRNASRGGWSGPPGDDGDTDSVSGSSTRSQESSPSASPYQSRHQPLSATRSLGDLADDEPPSPEKDTSSRPPVSHFNGILLSRAAQTHTFRKLRTPSRCKACDSYVYFQGAECDRCGVTSHKKCLETLQYACYHGQQIAERRMTTFGIDFCEHLRLSDEVVPYVVRMCIEEIDKNGVDLKGIYRMSGAKTKVERLCQRFETNQGHVDLEEEHPNVVANVLKLYLRQLPEPLLSFRLYPHLVGMAREEQNNRQLDGGVPESILRQLKAYMLELPTPNFRTCGVLMYHLRRVADNQPVNAMTASNLGIVFGPTLLRPSEGAVSLDSLMDTPHQTRIIELLIINVQTIFGTEEQLMPPKPEETKDKPDSAAGGPKSPELEITGNLMNEICEDQKMKEVLEDYVILPGVMQSVADEMPEPTPQEPASNPTDPPTPDCAGYGNSFHSNITEEDDESLPDHFLPDDSGSPSNAHAHLQPLHPPPTPPAEHPAVTIAATHMSLVRTVSSPTSPPPTAKLWPELSLSQSNPDFTELNDGPHTGYGNNSGSFGSLEDFAVHSPGLHRRLLPSDVMGNRSVTISSPEKPPPLSQPRPYSPPLARVPPYQPRTHIKKPGSPDGTQSCPSSADSSPAFGRDALHLGRSTFYSPSSPDELLEESLVASHGAPSASMETQDRSSRSVFYTPTPSYEPDVDGSSSQGPAHSSDAGSEGGCPPGTLGWVPVDEGRKEEYV